MVNSRFVFFLFCFSVPYLCPAQTVNDSTGVTVDTVKSASVDTFYTRRRANRAALCSAVLPGLGQAYNKKYWKIPILYAGVAALAYFIDYNNRNYKDFRKAYEYRVDGDSTTIDAYVELYPDANSLLVRKDYYRRTRDLMWIISSGVYILNIIDAYVDGHLSDFDISDDLSLHAQPGFHYTAGHDIVPAISCTFTFR